MDNTLPAERPITEYPTTNPLADASTLLQFGYLPMLRNRLTITVAEFRGLSGLGKTKTFDLISSKTLDSTLVDGRRLITVLSAVRVLAPSLLQGGE